MHKSVPGVLGLDRDVPTLRWPDVLVFWRFDSSTFRRFGPSQPFSACPSLFRPRATAKSHARNAQCGQRRRMFHPFSDISEYVRILSVRRGGGGIQATPASPSEPSPPDVEVPT